MDQQSQESAADPETSAMDQQPQEPAPDPETPAVAVQPPQEPNVHPPRRRRLALILSALAVVLVAGVSLGSYLVITRAQHSHAPTTRALPTPTPTIPLAQRWRLVDSPTIGKDSTLLSGVAASSPTDAWAWGADTITSTSNGGPGYVSEAPLFLHWDGQGWKTMTIPPDPHLVNIIIGGIAALSPDNAWLVGSAETVEGGFGDVFPSCVLMHWDGHQWSQTSPPASLLQHSSCELEGITALSATDIWAVGYTGDLAPAGSTFLINVRQTLIVHWDGQQWSVVPSPHPGADRLLTRITARAANDIWAIGGLRQQLPMPGVSSPSQTLIEHWDGHQWSVVPSPNPGTTANTLSGITALAPNDVWVVGQYGSTYIAAPNGGRVLSEQPLTMHWDGQQWSVVSGPALPGNPQESALNAVAALGPDDIWAVGSSTATGPALLPPRSVHISHMLIEHWDGKQWSIVAVQAPGLGSILSGLAQVPNTGQMWAVGGWSQSTDPTTPITTLTLLMAP